MTIRELVKNEIDLLPDDALYVVRDFVLSQKERLTDDMFIHGIINHNGIAFDTAVSKENRPKMSREAVFGCMRGQFSMADDFDAPLEDFKEYME